MKGYQECQTRDRRERDRLIVEHLEVAKRIALRIARRVPDWLAVDDLVSAAVIGLTEAADRYDSTRAEPFVAFASKRIRGEVLDALRRGDIMPRRVRSKARQIGKVIRKLEHDLGRAPEDEEVAEALGVSVSEYQEGLSVLTHVAVVELKPPEIAPSLHTSPNAMSPADQVERADMISYVRKGLGKLAERDARVLQLYYMEELTYSEIGKLLGVSESRVCQLHSRAISRLSVEMPGLREAA